MQAPLLAPLDTHRGCATGHARAAPLPASPLHAAHKLFVGTWLQVGVVDVQAVPLVAVQVPQVHFVVSHRVPARFPAQSASVPHSTQRPVAVPPVRHTGRAALVHARDVPAPKAPSHPAHTLLVGTVLHTGVVPLQPLPFVAVQVPQVNFVGSHKAPLLFTAQSRSLLHCRHVCAVELQSGVPERVEQSVLATQPPH